MTARSQPQGERVSWVTPRRITLALTLSVVVGCSGSPASTTLPPASTTTTAQSTTSTEPPATTSTAPPTTTTATTMPLPPEEEVEAAWDAYWAAWTEVRGTNHLDSAPLERVASAAVVDNAVALFERERNTGPGPIETDVVAGATVVDLTAERATIEDCVLLSPSFTNTTGVRYEAELRLRPRGWVVTDLRIPSGAGCVPAEMAAAAVASYEEYYEARSEFWDPPDPASQLVSQLLAEPQLTFTRDLLAEHRSRGVALRGEPSVHPEIVEVRGPGEVVILDCSEPHPDYGVYDLETGERLADAPPIRDSQTNLTSAVMVIENGTWKISDLQGQVDFVCEFAPTDRGLPSI